MPGTLCLYRIIAFGSDPALPYIMGANITTFVDTLLVDMLLENPLGLTVVLAEMMSLLLISVLVLLLLYRTYKDALLRFVDWTLHDLRHLAIFLVSVVLRSYLCSCNQHLALH